MSDITFSCNLADDSILEMLSLATEDYKDRVLNYRPYSDGEVERAVVEVAQWAGNESATAADVIWLNCLTKKNAPKAPESKDALRAAAHATNKYLSTIQWGNGRSRLDFTLQQEVMACRNPQGLDFQGPDSYMDQLMGARQSVNRGPIERRLSGWVNRTGLISGRIRRTIGAVTEQAEWRPHNIYDAAARAHTHLHLYPATYIVAPFMQGDHSSVPFRALQIISVSLYSVIPLYNRLILAERPQVSFSDSGQLHKEDGPAIWFPKLKAGGYFLNGVALPKYLVTTPADKLDPVQLPKIRNAEVRREFVRKVGIERVLAGLAAEVIDKTEGYELVNLNLGDGRRRPYLKMANPSLQGVWHIEGVASHCATVADALLFRNGTNVPPTNLT